MYIGKLNFDQAPGERNGEQNIDVIFFDDGSVEIEIEEFDKPAIFITLDRRQILLLTAVLSLDLQK